MVFIVLEDERAPIFTREILKEYPSSCVVKINTKSFKTDFNLLQSKPTLTDKWLVLVNSKISKVYVEQLAKLKTINMLVYCSQNNYKEKLSICRNSCETKFLNVISMTLPSCVNYIKSQLEIAEDVAVKLAKKCNLYTPFVEESIILLKTLDHKITSYDVDNYVQKRSNVTVYTLFYYLLERNGNVDGILKFIYEYRHALDYLKKRLLKLFSYAETIYMSMETGELGNDNVDEFIENNDIDASSYFVRRVIHIHQSIGYDLLLLNKITIENLDSIPSLLSIL